MIADMMNSEELSTNLSDIAVNPESIKTLNRANGNGELVLSLSHYETLKRARKRLLSTEPICFLKSTNPLILAHYKKLLIEYVAKKKDRSVVYYKGGSVDALLSVINTSTKSYSMDKVLVSKNNILARDKLILVVEREEDLIDDEWALLELFKSDLRFGPMGVIAATSSNLRETDIKRIPQNFLFEFEELNEYELEILDRVQIPQKFSFGFEYIQTRKESGIFEEVQEVQEGGGDLPDLHEIPISGSMGSKLINALTVDELSMLVFFTLLAFEIVFFVGRSGFFG